MPTQARVPGLAFPIPTKTLFGADEFLPAEDLAELGGEQIRRHPTRLGFLRNYRIAFLWKAKGGQSQGMATFGKCEKASPLVRHFGKYDLVVWAAADHARDTGLTHRQIEALVLHLLLHPHEDEETSQLKLIGHDFEGFIYELEEYGPWSAELQIAVRTARKLQVDDEDEEAA